MLIRRVATAGVIALTLIGQANARTLDQTPTYFKSEGPFVSYPSIAVGALGGLVGGVLALPASLVAAPIGLAAGDPVGYAMVPVSVLATGGVEVGYHVGGAIPWALKNTFYDAPMYGIAKAKGERPSGDVAAVDPPPSDPMLNQYLESTPPAARVPVELSRTRSLALKPPPELTSLMLKRSMSPFVLPPEVARQFQNMQPAGSIPMRTAPSSAPAASAPAPVASASGSSMPAQSGAGQPASPGPSQARESAAPSPAYTAPAGSAERPTLKRKKKSFSERFGF